MRFTRKEQRYFEKIISSTSSNGLINGYDIPMIAEIIDRHPDAIIKLSRRKAERFDAYCQTTDVFI